MDDGQMDLAAVIGKASYFMVMGIDVAVRTAEVGGSESFSVAEQIIPPGSGFPQHSLKTDTILIGLGGRITLIVGDHSLEVDDAHTAFIPAGRFFGYRNEHSDEARIIVITAARGHARFLRDLALNPRGLERTAARHQVTMGRDAQATLVPGHQPAW